MKTLYNLFVDVIKAKNFKLEDMTVKIKRSYIIGDITEAEHDELIALMTENLNPDAERPEWFDFAKGIVARIEALEQMVKTETTAPESGTAEYEEWQPWDGISNKYQYGAIVKHNGGLYQSTFNGQNVWEPGTVQFWVAYTE